MSFYIDNDELSYKMGEDVMLHINPVPEKYNKIWNTPDGCFYKPDDFKDAENIPDITIWAYYLILNEKAYNKLYKVLEPQGEFLSVNCEGYSYYIYNPLVIADEMNAVNTEKTSKNVVDGVYLGLNSIEFKEEKLTGILLFKTAYDFNPIFCTEKFKDIVKQNNLDGLLFKENLEGIV